MSVCSRFRRDVGWSDAPDAPLLALSSLQLRRALVLDAADRWRHPVRSRLFAERGMCEHASPRGCRMHTSRTVDWGHPQAAGSMRSLSRRYLVLLSLGLALFATLAVTGTWALRSMSDAMRLRSEARESLLITSSLLQALVDIETGQRGYLLTGDREYLAPYDRGRRDYDELLRQLRASAERIPEIREPVARLGPHAERRVALSTAAVALRRSGTAAPRGLDRQLAAGLQAMEAVRMDTAVIDVRLRARIARFDRRVREVERRAFLLGAALTGVGVLAILGSLLVVRKEQRSRLEAEFDLQQANYALERRVAERTSELAEARTQLEGFARRLDQGVEAERRRLARDVHDELGQVFTALRLTLTSLGMRHRLPKEEMDAMGQLILEGVQSSRRIAAQLRPPLLDELGLSDALAFRADAFRGETGIACEADVTDTDALEPEQATQLFRIAQEGLTNVARHAGAANTWIIGRRQDGVYELVIEDDGHGLREARPGSAGLINMHERAQLAGGRLEIGPSMHGGLRLRALVPLNGATA
jgi:signal transduction histidine kinase